MAAQSSSAKLPPTASYVPSEKRSELKGRNFWGPPIWELIHSLADKYTSDKREAYLKFLLLLTRLLPCLMCRKNLIKKLKLHPPTKYMDSANELLYYTYAIHDLANKHISKFHPDNPKTSPSYSDVTKRYQNQSTVALNNIVWHVIHILSTTLRYESGESYAEMLSVIAELVPDRHMGTYISQFLKTYPVEPYLRNNNDAFTYSYMLHDFVARKMMDKIQSYGVTKNFYFNALGEGCNDCKV